MKPTKTSYAKEPVLPGIFATIICAVLILIVGKLFFSRIDHELGQYKVPKTETKTSVAGNLDVQTSVSASIVKSNIPGKD